MVATNVLPTTPESPELWGCILLEFLAVTKASKCDVKLWIISK